MATEITGALDLWSVLVHNVAGNFLMATLCVILVIFLIMLLGRVSIYTTSWYLLFFVMVMTLGYGMVIYNVILDTFLVLGLILSIRGYIDRAGQ